ncbi:MAG: NAD(P)(+) transhydrogenase (Re/Si-specific) subunit beta [Bacteroidia bacterium]|nr:NAD(P)(+) transhydrogenase (Re/Si-specific) subunit beta [Bacteroidia bacterium]
MKTGLLEIIYLIGSVTFIVGLKMMGHPKTARKGNLVGAFGMTIAILGTIFLTEHDFNGLILGLIFLAIALGTAIGWITAKKVKITKMPELVSMFNGMGGACAALISMIELNHYYHSGIGDIPTGTMLAIILGLIIGSISFSGSIIAFMKLNGTMNKPIRLPAYNVINTAVLLLTMIYGGYMVATGGSSLHAWGIFAVALLYGMMFTIPIGGADMPVVISLLNSFTGLAAAFGGFLYDNKIMLTGGILVGSAGTLLTLVMCKAMNRPLSAVIFGAFGSSGATGGQDVKGSIKDNCHFLCNIRKYFNKIL